MLLIVVIFLMANVVADCLYAATDPRIRESL
jgi:ABC-type dipeptide/oligopeptide/nickel transport system permease component